MGQTYLDFHLCSVNDGKLDMQNNNNNYTVIMLFKQKEFLTKSFQHIFGVSLRI